MNKVINKIYTQLNLKLVSNKNDISKIEYLDLDTKCLYRFLENNSVYRITDQKTQYSIHRNNKNKVKRFLSTEDAMICSIPTILSYKQKIHTENYWI